jgi:cytochrome b
MTIDHSPAASVSAAATHRVRVWDLPTRLFHWALMLCVLGALLTAQIGGNWMEWHMRLGYAILSLLLFRLLWGVLGGHWSRFASFIYSPASLLRCVRGRVGPHDTFEVGHSPTGALSVFALLLVLLLQVGTGLFADDEIATSGPLLRFVSGATSQLLTAYHTEIGQALIFTLLGLHVAAIAFYVLKRRVTLIRPMVTGDKWLPFAAPASRDGWPSRLLALVLLAACVAGVVYLVGLGSLP